MRKLLLSSAIGALAVLCCRGGAGAPVRQPGPNSAYRAPEGRYSVTIADNVEVRDLKRNKQLSLKVYAPEGPGRFPVILFSHEIAASKESFGPLARYWASHGFVSIHPSHADAHARGALPAAGDGAPVGGDGRGLLEGKYETPQAGIRRAQDLISVLDSLDQVEKAVPQVRGKLDRKHVGAAGHSFGALAAMLLGGATLDLSESEPDRASPDARVDAILAISAPGTGEHGLTTRSWRKIYLPMLTVTGSQDRGDAGQGPEWKRQSYDLSRPGNKYHLSLQGAGRYSYGGELAGGGLAASGLGPGIRARLSGGRRVGFGGRSTGDQNGAFEAMKSATLGFWNAYLKADDQARAGLAANRLSAETRGLATLSHR